MTPTHLPHLLGELAVASTMTLVTVLVHLFGLALLVRMLKVSRRKPKGASPLSLLIQATLGLFVIHTLEMWLYAALYLALNAAFDLESALYFSTVTYSSVGYGDVLLPPQWRLVGAVEGATGIMMLGWSTAFLVSLLSQLKLLAHDWLTPQSH